MIYEHQINWATANDNNLIRYLYIVKSASELSVVPHFTSSSLLSRPCPNLTCCSLYEHKNSTTRKGCAVLALCYASGSSVLFKLTSVDFALSIVR